MMNLKNLFTILVSLVLIFTVKAFSQEPQYKTIIFDTEEQNKEDNIVYYLVGGKIDIIDSSGSWDREEKKELFSSLETEYQMKKYTNETGIRWMSNKNDILTVYVFYKKDGPKPEIKIDEKKRKTEFAGDISILLGIIKKMIMVEDKTKDKKYKVLYKKYILKNKHSNLSVFVSFKENESKKELSKSIKIIAGPTEHWFLSADLPIGKLNEVKFVEDEGTIEPAETPKEFYIGLNFLIGDRIAEKQTWYKYFYLKGMLKASKSPFDSYGFGIGIRIPKTKILGIDLSSFSVFAAYIWSKEEIEQEEITTEKTKHQILFGISYNLDKALGWLK